MRQLRGLHFPFKPKKLMVGGALQIHNFEGKL